MYREIKKATYFIIVSCFYRLLYCILTYIFSFMNLWIDYCGKRQCTFPRGR